MTAIYLQRYLNFGLTVDELQSGKPIIGIAQSGPDLSPCNRHHLELAKRVRDRHHRGRHKGWRTGSGTIVWKAREQLATGEIDYDEFLTRDSFRNAIAVSGAIGGSTNAPIHMQAIARHMGVDLSLSDWQTHGHDLPLLVNLQPAGEYLGEDFYREGVGQMDAGMVIEDAVRYQRIAQRKGLPRHSH